MAKIYHEWRVLQDHCFKTLLIMQHPPNMGLTDRFNRLINRLSWKIKMFDKFHNEKMKLNSSYSSWESNLNCAICWCVSMTSCTRRCSQTFNNSEGLLPWHKYVLASSRTHHHKQKQKWRFFVMIGKLKPHLPVYIQIIYSNEACTAEYKICQKF